MNRISRIFLAIIIATMLILVVDCMDGTMNTANFDMNILSWVCFIATYGLAIGVAWDED